MERKTIWNGSVRIGEDVITTDRDGFWDIFDVVGCIADLVAGILVLVNTNKLEKEYRAYVGPAKK